MKKTLVAIAALAAFGAQAQSSVQIDGIFDAGYQSVNYKGNKASGIAQNGSSTSQLNFRGVQDIGGGLKADFRLESDFNAVSTSANTGVAASINTTVANSNNGAASNFGNGEVRVGLNKDGIGRVDLGSVNYNTLSTYGGGQPFGTAIGSGFRTMYVNDTQATSQVRAENAVKLSTATFSGLNATLYKSNKQTKAGTVTASTVTGLVGQANAFSTSIGAYDQVGTTEAGLNYANGPLAASYSSLKQDWNGVAALGSSSAAAGSTKKTVNTSSANYTLGDIKLFALHQTNKTSDNATNNKATTFSGTYTMGNTVLLAQIGSLKDVAGNKSKLRGVGADYNLSKTAAVYLRAESIDDVAAEMNAAVTPSQIKGSGTKFTRSAVGLRVAF